MHRNFGVGKKIREKIFNGKDIPLGKKSGKRGLKFDFFKIFFHHFFLRPKIHLKFGGARKKLKKNIL